MTAKILIDNISYEADESKNILATALSLGLNLPYFCWHPALHSVGACRQCAVVKYKDENDRKGKIVMACLEPVANNIRISIESPEARQFRAGNIEALMTNHPHDCPVCDEGGECHLQDMTVMTGHNCRRYDFKKRTHSNQYLGPFVNHEMNRCIQCYRCVRFYKDYAGGKDLDVFGSHDDVYFGRHEDGVLGNEFSGNLVEVCPTGVFTDKTLKKHFTRKWDLTDAPSVCHGCSLGCNIIASERYGTIRRILSRYNGDVNGYFLCDRGRFGYEYINSEKRIKFPSKKENGIFTDLKPVDIVQEIIQIIHSGKRTSGIGSPRASLESNFLLRQLVGAQSFYAGISRAEGKLILRIIEILRNGKVKTPSLNSVKEYETVFIIGEDVTNTAPMLALNLRQAAKKKPVELAKAMKIHEWNDAAIRDVVQGITGPFFIATAHATKLDEIATCSYHAHPDQIARLAAAVAHEVNIHLPEVEMDEETSKLSQAITTAMLESNKILIVSGTSLLNEGIIDSAYSLALALQEKGKEVGLVFIVPEANSIGLTMIATQFLEDIYKKEPSGRNENLIILENDLYDRMPKKSTDIFLKQYENILTLDYLENPTTQLSNYILPAGTFAEADGTIVNNEGRAQRFYEVHVPENEVRSSWKWLQTLINNNTDLPIKHFDAVMASFIKEFPEFHSLISLAPDSDFREGTQKIPREPHRYSGRTSMHADVNVNEPRPPLDSDSALSFTMEGYEGLAPSSIIPFYWSPGWNSVQAINKYQIEVGGPLHGGNPGKRLFEPSNDNREENLNNIPAPFLSKPGEVLVFPVYHLFGSDELSALSPGIKERIPNIYISLNNEDASQAGISDGDLIEIHFNEEIHTLPVKLNAGFARGTAGLPKGLKETRGVQFPFWAALKNSKNE